jgi:hypothetical protein
MSDIQTPADLALAAALAVQTLQGHVFGESGNSRISATLGNKLGYIFVNSGRDMAGFIRATVEGEWDVTNVKGRGVRGAVYVALYNAGFPVGEHNY